MSANDFVIKPVATGGIQIHRATCKRVEGHDLPTLAERYLNDEGSWNAAFTLQDADTLTNAKLASCCKPRGAALYQEEASVTTGLFNQHGVTTLAELLPLLPVQEDQGIQEELVERESEGKEALVAPEPDDEDEDLIGDVEQTKTKPVIEYPLDGVKVSKHYHDALIKVVGPLLEGTREDLKELAAEAFAALGKWRRADDDYKALPPQDSKWVTSDRYAWERDFLIGYAQQVVGQRPKSTYAKEGNLAARRGAAAAKAARSL